MSVYTQSCMFVGFHIGCLEVRIEDEAGLGTSGLFDEFTQRVVHGGLT